MKQNVDPVITRRIQAPEGVFDTKYRIDEREVLRWRIKGKPDAPQAIRGGEQFVLRVVPVVIPNKTSVPRQLVSKDGRQNKKQSPIPVCAIERQQERFGWTLSPYWDLFCAVHCEIWNCTA